MKKAYFLNQTAVSIWEAKEPRVILQLVHGMVEHIGRYDDFAQYLVAHGVTVVGYDHIGHGRSALNPSDYGVFPKDKELLVDQLVDVREEIRRRYPDVPVVLMGHSMGSLVVRYATGTRELDLAGLIIMGTGQRPRLETGSALFLANTLQLVFGAHHRSRLLTYLSTDRFNRQVLSPQTKVDWLSLNPQSNQAYLLDPHCQFIPTTSMYRIIFDLAYRVASEELILQTPKYIPILLLSGQEDPLGDKGKGVKKLYDLYHNAGYRVSLTLIPNARHEILNERDHLVSYEKVMTFINEALRLDSENEICYT